MPVVLPLIIKGMCDNNPYMVDHQPSDYINEHFLETGILDWLTEKKLTTDDITANWQLQYMFGKEYDQVEYVFGGIPTSDYYHDVLNAAGTSTLGKIMKPEALAYFSNLYDTYKDSYTSAEGIPLPTKRGLMEDLHYALESNNMTKGWQPQHPIFLYHSYSDTVVPEVNRERADNTIGDWVIKVHAGGPIQFDHVGTGIQFFLGLAEFDAIRALAKAPLHPSLEKMKQIRKDFAEDTPVDD